MPEANPLNSHGPAESFSVTVLRNIAGGHWNAGRGDLAISVEQYAADCLSAIYTEQETWRATALAALEALSVIPPENLEALAVILDECDRRRVWWFEDSGDEVQRDLRKLAALQRVALGFYPLSPQGAL